MTPILYLCTFCGNADGVEMGLLSLSPKLSQAGSSSLRLLNSRLIVGYNAICGNIVRDT